MTSQVVQCLPTPRLRVVSNFGDRLPGAGEIHARARDFEETRREGSSPRVTSSRNFARARVCISPAPQSPSPKLETTRSLPDSNVGIEKYDSGSERVD